jgi:hypothetical protein
MGRTKKNVQQRTNVSSEESVDSADKLDAILQKLAGLDSITSKLTNMESLLSAMQSENKMLKETIIKQDSTILELRERVNNLEQHGRSFSIRVNNLPLEANEERDPPSVIKKVYNSVFLPILQGAAAQQAISAVPICFDMIEMAHPLPGRGDKPKPIIVRFFNRNLKSLLFKHRKEYAAKDDQGGPRPRYKYHIHDDLTRDSFMKMKSLQNDPRVNACWSTGGTLPYRLHDCNIIRKVPSVYMSNDDILK